MRPTKPSTLLAGSMLALALTGPGPARANQIKSVVIVHGALADGSGWRKVYDRLTTRGYKVTVVQPPMTSLRDDVDATLRILELQQGEL